MMHTRLFREIKELYRFFKTSKVEKSIVFYSERKGHYPFFEGIMNELMHKHGLSICYVTSDPNDPILETNNPQIKSFYINKLLTIFFSLVNCKVFVMTLTDLNQFHLKRSVHQVHYVYLFHTLASTHMAFRKGSFDHYDSILCPGVQQLEEIKKYEELYNLPKKQLVESGYYRLEQLYDEFKDYKKESSSNVKGTVLVAPSWGDQNIIESSGKRLVKLLLDANYHVILRPHSETVKRNKELIEEFKRLYGNNPNFTLEILSHTNESLLKADVLITDYSGIAIVYAFGTERPVLFIDVPKKIKNPEYEKLGMGPLELSLRTEIGKLLAPDNLDKVVETVEYLMKNMEMYKERNAELREKYIYAFGRSSQVSAQHIVDVYKKSNETVAQ
jgi:CDP-glycerol glycerophosphotransferase (TagB/SpsB family)